MFMFLSWASYVMCVFQMVIACRLWVLHQLHMASYVCFSHVRNVYKFYMGIAFYFKQITSLWNPYSILMWSTLWFLSVSGAMLIKLAYYCNDFIFNRKSGDVQGSGHRCLQISPPSAHLGTQEGAIPLAWINTWCFLFVAHRHRSIRITVKGCATKHSHVNWLPCWLSRLRRGSIAICYLVSAAWKSYIRFTDFS